MVYQAKVKRKAHEQMGSEHIGNQITRVSDWRDFGNHENSFAIREADVNLESCV